MPSMYQGVPYIYFQGVMKGRIQEISRHREGQESSEMDPCQGKLQKDLDYAHIPMYVGLRVKSTYIRKNGFKSHIYQIIHVFRDDIGNIKGTKRSMGSKKSTEGHGRP